MKKLFFVLFISVISVIKAQQEPPNFEFGIGPALGMKSSVSYIETPTGRKNGVAFAKLPAFNLNSFIPLSYDNRIAIEFDIGYETYSYIIQDYDYEIDYKNNHSYFTINPNFYFANFLFGFNVGFPVAADYDDIKIDEGTLNTSFEIVLGGMFNIYNDETGRFNFFVKAQYMLTGVYDEFLENDPFKDPKISDIHEVVKESHNPKTVSLLIGFNYMFNLSQRNVEE